jgi:hypothetical protein
MPIQTPSIPSRITPTHEQLVAKLQTIRKDPTIGFRKFRDNVLAQLRDDDNWNIGTKRLYPVMNKQRRERLRDNAQAIQLECIKKGHLMLYGPGYVKIIYLVSTITLLTDDS